mmetsp:Transcript_1260/g.1803  ORF Transcript_1260/g.1803 Transcript_1260/m.1803 type:complete len:281 (-) Transcript_1260:169-1011(-)|eukprot:CAMPEP_0184869866 /NCGR_PEP_ID=MMETSP0580-20130426/35635_1 /TAXON_ID=1118495 /ORGANISM="Dactyliosolen fragilissimus" /LENGTH=280 /DNA_ID=CAMNT_0027371649 /DNA_START=285 /DNA_END=1127 /DNA_ORIENTATION=-
MAAVISDAAVAAIVAAVTESIVETISAAITVGISDEFLTSISLSIELEVTEAVTLQITEITDILVSTAGINNDVAGIISTYLIAPELSLGEFTWQQTIDNFLARAFDWFRNNPYTSLLQVATEGQEPTIITDEEREKERAYWGGLLDEAKEKVLKMAAPGVQSYIRDGYEASLNAAKAENTKWLKKQKKDIMLKGLIPIYGQVRAAIRLSHLKNDAMKQFYSAANSHSMTFLHSQECREKWGKSFEEEGDKFLKSDEWKNMVEDWTQKHPNNPNNQVTCP